MHLKLHGGPNTLTAEVAAGGARTPWSLADCVCLCCLGMSTGVACGWQAALQACSLSCLLLLIVPSRVPILPAWHTVGSVPAALFTASYRPKPFIGHGCSLCSPAQLACLTECNDARAPWWSLLLPAVIEQPTLLPRHPCAVHSRTTPLWQLVGLQ